MLNPMARHALFLVFAVALVYANACRSAFQFDDFNVIVDNAAVHSWPAWFASMPGIRPLLKLSYTFSWVSGSGSPVPFHVFNVLCHALNAVLVYTLARHWMARFAPTLADPGRTALLVALLFALHPAQTEAVTYASGRSVSLMAMFYLAAILAWLHGEARQRSIWRHLVSPLLMVAALAVKETAWTLPFALLLWQGARGQPWREAMADLRTHWGVLALAVLAMLATPGYQRLLAGSLAAREFGPHLLAMVEGQYYLLTHPLLGLQLNIDPDIAVPVGADAVWLLKLAVLLGLLGWGLRCLRQQPWLGLGVAWWFLHLLPTNSLLPRADIANDRQLYLAVIGLALPMAIVLCRRWPHRLVPVVIALLLLLGTATVLRNQDYGSEVALWQATVAGSPGKPRAWNNLGYAHRLAGNRAAARAAFQQALALDPGNVQARANLIGIDRRTP